MTVAPHLFSVDVEEHFQVSAFDRVLTRDQWPAQPSRVESNTDRLLELLARHDARGTFFTLGWVADRHPALIKRIAGAGHELASHGWWHYKVTALSPPAFREEIRRSKGILEEIAGAPVRGFRAPSFSIVPGTEWAFDILLEEGYRYDSSVFPIRRAGYGYPGAPVIPYQIRRPAGVLLELPLATTLAGGVRVPAAGGAWFRHLPYAVTDRAFREHERKGDGAMFYIHPWEIDEGQPRLPVSILQRLRHYGGLSRTAPRLERLLTTYRFVSAERRYDVAA